MEVSVGMELSVGTPGVQMSGNTFPACEEPQVTPTAGPDRKPHEPDSQHPVAGAASHTDSRPGPKGSSRATAEHPSNEQILPGRHLPAYHTPTPSVDPG